MYFLIDKENVYYLVGLQNVVVHILKAFFTTLKTTKL